LRGGGLDDERSTRSEDLGQVLNQRVLQGRKPPVGRIDEDEIVAGARAGIGAQGGERVLAENRCALQSELVEVAVDGAAGVAVVLDKGRALGPSRERFEP